MPRRTTLAPEDDILLALVCHYLVKEGCKPADIRDKLDKVHKITLEKTADIWSLIAKAARRKMLCYVSPEHNVLSEKMRTAFPDITTDVALTSLVDDVAARGAAVVLDLIKTHPPHHREEIHVGFSGGHMVRKLFRALTQLLAMPSDSLPKRIVFHALVGGFSTDAPGTDPTSFFTYLADLPPNLDMRFVLFHAPPIIPPEQFETFFELPAAKAARDQARDVDLIVTSAAVFEDEHSQLRDY